MSNKYKKIRNKKETEFNSINDYYLENELNFQNIKNKNKFISYENHINLLEENESIKQKEDSYIIDNEILQNKNSKEINDQINLNSNQFTEEDVNADINNSQDDELPLITLNFISICQCCKNKFDNKNNIPYLLKCGHFFCINCIKQYFTDETGIICPSDGLVAKSINELKLLKNLIIEPRKSEYNNLNNQKNIYVQNNSLNLNTINSNNDNEYLMNFCPIHKNQQLSHIINDTNEIICVHCAFERLKSNPNLNIKEIKEKYREYNNNLETIIINGQKNIELIEHTLELINKNRENEEKKLDIFYNNIITFLETQRKENKEQIHNIFKENTHDLEQKLLIFYEIIQQGKDFQKNLEKDKENNSQNYSKVINNYNNILKLNKSNNDDNINNKLKYIKFTNENESNIKEYLSKISNLNIIYRIIKYVKNRKASLKDNNIKNSKNKYKKNEKKIDDKPLIKYKKNIPNRKNII